MRSTAVKFTLLELVWGALAITLTLGGLCVVALAQAGFFRGWTLLLAGVIAVALGWVFFQTHRQYGHQTPRRETLFVTLVLGAGFLLYAWPAEEFPQKGDASIYPNTAAMLIRTGGLAYQYSPLDDLTPEQKELFYIPSDRQLPGMTIESYQGLLYGAYYVMDPVHNTIVSSRPTLTIAWMGLLGMVFGAQGMPYVTALFGAASLITVYFLGKRLFSVGAGALAAVWLLVSFPQLYFSRAPYAEVVGQFFVLTFLYALVAYWQTHSLAYIPMALAAWTAALAARIDSLLALPTLLLFIVLLAANKDWRATVMGVAGLVMAAAFTVWTVNRPYVGATAELLVSWQLRFLQRLPIGAAFAVTLVGLAGVVLLVWLARRVPVAWWRRVSGWGLSLVVVAGIGYALHIRPQLPEYALVQGNLLPTHDEELMAVAARYLSPVLFWLAATGIFLIPFRKKNLVEQLLLLLFTASCGAVFFWQYTTGRVYPVALRRLLPEVVPGLCLFGASAVSWLGQRPRLRWGAVAAAGLTTSLLMALSVPYWFHQEAVGALDLIDTLSESIPSDAVALFEPQQGEAVVGWFAAPLWSLHQRDALLLNSGELDGDLLAETICHWQRQGKEVYIIAQHEPATWWPGAFWGHQEGQVSWKSGIIGQSLRFPPFIWRFAFTFTIYHWDGSSCVPS